MKTAITPAEQADNRFTYPGGMEGRVDIGVGYLEKDGNFN